MGALHMGRGSAAGWADATSPSWRNLGGGKALYMAGHDGKPITSLPIGRAEIGAEGSLALPSGRRRGQGGESDKEI